MKSAILLILFGLQTQTSVWDGVYSGNQGDRGRPLYVRECASCHGDSLQGRGQAPPLAGSEFLQGWEGQTLSDLFEKISLTMPADGPGRLTKDVNADILAYMLLINKFPAGEGELMGDGERLSKIVITASPKR